RVQSHPRPSVAHSPCVSLGRSAVKEESMHAHRTQRRRAARLFEGLAELRRTPVRFAAHLAVARLVTQWRSLLTIIAGAILSASIGALVPLYTTAVAQVGMTQR